MACGASPDLDAFRENTGIKTVMAAGTTAPALVLHAASGAALRGHGVIVPIDNRTRRFTSPPHRG
jgi:hypothetical protein